MHRFFFEHAVLEPGTSVDLTPLAHQLGRVLRLASGAEIELLDDSGRAFRTTILSLDRGSAQGQVLAVRTLMSEPPVEITLYQCSLKADKFEWILQKGAELGVTRFAPVIAARSIVRPAAALEKRYDRWCTILREAAEQSGRARLPRLLPVMDWHQAIGHPADGIRLLPWEEAGDDHVGLGHAVAEAGRSHTVAEAGRSHTVALLIGPEGGITSQEVHTAREAGWQVVGLGPRILRAETAALAAATVVLDRLAALE